MKVCLCSVSDEGQIAGKAPQPDSCLFIPSEQGLTTTTSKQWQLKLPEVGCDLRVQGNATSEAKHYHGISQELSCDLRSPLTTPCLVLLDRTHIPTEHISACICYNITHKSLCMDIHPTHWQQGAVSKALQKAFNVLQSRGLLTKEALELMVACTGASRVWSMWNGDIILGSLSG